MKSPVHSLDYIYTNPIVIPIKSVSIRNLLDTFSTTFIIMRKILTPMSNIFRRSWAWFCSFCNFSRTFTFSLVSAIIGMSNSDSFLNPIIRFYVFTFIVFLVFLSNHKVFSDFYVRRQYLVCVATL